MSFFIKKDKNDNQSANILYPNMKDAIRHCPNGYSVFDLYGKCVYTKIEQQDCTYEDTSVENTLIKFEHDKYRYIWEELKKNITNKINGLHSEEAESINKHVEALVEERELMRILMMMKSLENNEPIF